MRFYQLLSIVTLGLVLTACGLLPASLLTRSEPEPDPAMIEAGVAIYRANYCGSCHTMSAANTRGTFGPNHDAAGLRAREHVALESYTGTATSAADYIRESILNPTVFYTPGYEQTNHHMPAFTHLPESDIEALVYLLMNQRAETGE